MLEGSGDGFCQLTLVPATGVCRQERPGLHRWPCPNRAAGPCSTAPWSVPSCPKGLRTGKSAFRPAINLEELQNVEVLTRTLNPQRINSPGVLAQ
ncbi:MAG: hypothetical protein Ct9H300mP1_31920 [Planctomycetaceae bacterium]|nr:MAG: hypothetical protein Ct9H300mP1_31920 [Planctomycetaceae bacterium]